MLTMQISHGDDQVNCQSVGSVVWRRPPASVGPHERRRGVKICQKKFKKKSNSLITKYFELIFQTNKKIVSRPYIETQLTLIEFSGNALPVAVAGTVRVRTCTADGVATTR